LPLDFPSSLLPPQCIFWRQAKTFHIIFDAIPPGLPQTAWVKVGWCFQKMHCGGTSEEGKSRGQLANSDLPGKWPSKRYEMTRA